jgi:hypothetical protein
MFIQKQKYTPGATLAPLRASIRKDNASYRHQFINSTVFLKIEDESMHRSLGKPEQVLIADIDPLEI